MGDQTTAGPSGAAEVPGTPEADTERAVGSGAPGVGAAGSDAPGVGTVVSRTFGWLVFAGGLGAAGYGIATLEVVISVVGLILACTAGLTLLKLRAGGPGPESGVRIAG